MTVTRTRVPGRRGPTVEKPTEALDQHLVLLDWWERNVIRHAAAAAFQEVGPGKINVPLDEFIAWRLARSETFYVTAQIVNRLWGFARHYETQAPLQREDLPCERGYVWLQAPGYILDVRGRMTPIKVIHWSVEPECVVLFFYNDWKDPYDEVGKDIIADPRHAEMAKQDARTPLFHWSAWRWGESRMRDWTDARIASIPESYPARLEGTPEATPETIKAGIQEQIIMEQFVVSLWEFMGEQMPGRMFPDRAGRRRLEHAGVSFKEVKIVDLRTVANNYPRSENPELVNWSHRWRVRPHKRRWYDKDGNYRETTVAGYIKGPKDLPLWEQNQVFNVRR